MNRSLVPAAILLFVTSACNPKDAHPLRSLGIEKYPTARDLYALAETHRLKHKLPALGIGIVHRGRILGLGMAGERSYGSMDWATLDDAFDVASCSKPVTASVSAMLVSEGKIRLDTTLGETFPELRNVMDPGYAGVTLEMLLSHRAGVGHQMNRNALWAAWNQQHTTQTPTGQRLKFVENALKRPPSYKPGSNRLYTSDGYIIAGAMLERAAQKDWESLTQSKLFQSLRLLSMSYGPISVGGTITKVSGHEDGWLGRSVIVPPDPAEYGVHPFGAPAGFLYTSVPDLLRFVDFNIRAWNENKGLRDLGWESEVKRDKQGRIYEHSVYHGGYSGRFRTNMWFAPETQWGTVIVTNHGKGDESITADIFYALLKEFKLQ